MVTGGPAADRAGSSAGDSVGEQDVLGLTAKGSAELGEARTSLPAQELEVLVLIDGRSTVAQIVRSARAGAREAVLETIGKLRDAGLVRVASETPYGAIDAGDFFSGKIPAGATPGDDAEAAAGVSSLRHKGYYVRIARRAGDAPAREEGRKLSVLVIEDELHLAKLLGTYLKLEDFMPRTAGNRETILAELRKPEPLDLVLLDVVLPDADGFDVLASMRRHPRFKSVPVIMLTARATREAVLMGLRCGADGYITKPFEVEVLMRAVKTVLGLEGAQPDIELGKPDA
jgi:two-component system OmpR family response regulator